MVPGSGSGNKPILDLGSRGQKGSGSGSATLVDSDNFFYCVSVGTTAVLSAGVYFTVYHIGSWMLSLKN
jgi:hypothetical protein